MTAAHGRVGVGVIGAGVISTQYLANLTSFPDLDVRFIADLDTSRARAQAASFGVTGAGSVEELLADPDIEIVVNLTIPSAHVSVALQCLEAGKNVWTEKPFALDRESGKQLLAAAHDRGLRVATAPDTFLGAGIQTAARLIQDGAIGAPLTAITMIQNSGPDSWHPNPEFLFQSGGGPLLDIGPYYITALVQLLGPVHRVSAVSSTAYSRRRIGAGPRADHWFDVTVPTHVAATMEFAEGRTAQSVFSFDSKVHRILFEVAGTEGTIVVPDPNQFEGDITVHTGPSDQTTSPSHGSTSTRGTGVVELARALRAGVPERASGELAYHVLDVMLSILDATQTRSPVPVNSTTERPALLPLDWTPRKAALLAPGSY